MFNANDIPVKYEDLRKLFLHHHHVDSNLNDENKIDFYKLALFSISQQSDQDYRNFMRKLKEKMDIGGQQKERYLPMSFNKTLEYFSDRGKIRANMMNIKSNIVKYYYLYRIKLIYLRQ
jgi:hypothetical protein